MNEPARNIRHGLLDPGGHAKTCPDCAEDVLTAARKCRYCGYRWDNVTTSPDAPNDMGRISDADDYVSPNPASTDPVPSPEAAAQGFDWERAVSVGAKLISFRIALSATTTAIVMAFLTALIWDPLVYPVGWGTFLLVWIGLAFDPDTNTRCPHCRKFIKLDAKACHKCGRGIRAP